MIRVPLSILFHSMFSVCLIVLLLRVIFYPYITSPGDSVGMSVAANFSPFLFVTFTGAS